VSLETSCLVLCRPITQLTVKTFLNVMQAVHKLTVSEYSLQCCNSHNSRETNALPPTVDMKECSVLVRCDAV